MASEPTGPAYDASDQPLPPSDAPTEEMAPTAPEEPQNASTGIDLPLEFAQAISAALKHVKSFATGETEQIDTASLKEGAEAVRQLAEGLALLDPPTPPLDPNVVQKDSTDAAKAALQDDQKDRDIELQRELGHQREGRPSGPAKP